MAALELKQRIGLPMVYEAHGIMWDNPNFPRPFGPIKPLNWALRWSIRLVQGYYERKVVRTSDHLIVQTESARKRLKKLYNLKDKPITVIHNGVDADKFDPQRWQDRRNPLRQEHGWEDRVVCLYAGYLNNINGIEFLLDSLSSLGDNARSRLKIVLMGRGPLRQAVEKAAEQFSNLIDFPGLVKSEDMPAYYAASDVFMIPRPSYLPAETLVPMKLLEAMAMEKVILVSDVAAMAEIIADGQNGLLFTKGNPDSFVHKLEDIAVNHDKLTHLGRRARQDVLERYTWEKSRSQLQAIYGQLVGS
jgi:glycosyltransferase involved in cell wall biosynthesis